MSESRARAIESVGTIRRVCAFMLLLAPLALAPVASGQTAQFTSTTYVWDWWNRPQGAIFDSFLCTASPSAISGACGAGIVADNFVSANAGALKARASLTAAGWLFEPNTTRPSDFNGQVGATSTAQVNAIDYVSFAGLTPSVLRFSYSISGTSTFVGPAAGAVNPRVTFSAGSNPTSFVFSDRVVTPGTVNYQDYGFVDWVVTAPGAVRFELGMLNTATIVGPLGQALTGNFSANFSNSAYLGVQALDANGVDITDAAQLRFDSGQTYATSVVPEPSTISLLAAGLLSVLLAHKRKRRN